MDKDLDVARTFHLGNYLAMKLIIVSILNTLRTIILLNCICTCTIYHHRHLCIFVPPYLEHKTIEFDFFPQYR